jgi:hypothetical protein
MPKDIYAESYNPSANSTIIATVSGRRHGQDHHRGARERARTARPQSKCAVPAPRDRSRCRSLLARGGCHRALSRAYCQRGSRQQPHALSRHQPPHPPGLSGADPSLARLCRQRCERRRAVRRRRGDDAEPRDGGRFRADGCGLGQCRLVGSESAALYHHGSRLSQFHRDADAFRIAHPPPRLASLSGVVERQLHPPDRRFPADGRDRRAGLYLLLPDRRDQPVGPSRYRGGARRASDVFAEGAAHRLDRSELQRQSARSRREDHPRRRAYQHRHRRLSVSGVGLPHQCRVDRAGGGDRAETRSGTRYVEEARAILSADKP